MVDDDRLLRDATVSALAAEGVRAVAAADGREALDTLTSQRVEPCLIVLDLMMPAMDGWEFREHQLRDGRLASIPIVVVSAYADPRREATSMGAVAGLRKPILVDELLRLVSAVCRR